MDWQEDERLLKLYESGLPSWAIYMPRYGLPYRPWMRWHTWALFVAVATSSLIMGFWDLYKHMPYLEQVRWPDHSLFAVCQAHAS